MEAEGAMIRIFVSESGDGVGSECADADGRARVCTDTDAKDGREEGGRLEA